MTTRTKPRKRRLRKDRAERPPNLALPTDRAARGIQRNPSLMLVGLIVTTLISVSSLGLAWNANTRDARRFESESRIALSGTATLFDAGGDGWGDRGLGISTGQIGIRLNLINDSSKRIVIRGARLRIDNKTFAAALSDTDIGGFVPLGRRSAYTYFFKPANLDDDLAPLPLTVEPNSGENVAFFLTPYWEMGPAKDEDYDPAAAWNEVVKRQDGMWGKPKHGQWRLQLDIGGRWQSFPIELSVPGAGGPGPMVSEELDRDRNVRAIYLYVKGGGPTDVLWSARVWSQASNEVDMTVVRPINPSRENATFPLASLSPGRYVFALEASGEIRSTGTFVTPCPPRRTCLMTSEALAYREAVIEDREWRKHLEENPEMR